MTFEEALAAYRQGVGDGIGISLTANDPYAIAIDSGSYGCLNKHERPDEPCDWQLDGDLYRIITYLDSYTERTPNGSLLCIMRATLPKGVKSVCGLDLYDRDEFFPITGDRHPSSPLTIEERTGIITMLARRSK